jgi:serine protease SohB
MIETLIQVLVFLVQALIVFLVIAGVLLLIAALAQKNTKRKGLQLENLNEHYEGLKIQLLQFAKTKKDLKQALKSIAKDHKALSQRKERPILFVLNYKGDLKASGNSALREEISAILEVSSPKDEVLLKLESSGGMVAPYGLAAAQLSRLRAAQIPLTVAVDEVAASGGYLMAVIANKIIASPFAYIGSIGVAAPMPNVHRLLKRMDIDYKDYTAGEYKRTLGFFSEPTEKGEQKFIEQLEQIHAQFKDHLRLYRPNLELSKVATGEVWLGQKAKELNLIDEVMVSDDYIRSKVSEGYLALSLRLERPKNLIEKLSQTASACAEAATEKAIELLSKRNFF